VALIVADSDVLIDALRGRAPAQARIARALEAQELATTSVTLFELLSGAKSAASQSKVEQLLEALPILPFDPEASRVAAQVRRTLEAAGQAIGMAAYQIAGICLSHSAAFLTRNLAHFERVPGLRLERLDAEPEVTCTPQTWRRPARRRERRRLTAARRRAAGNERSAPPGPAPGWDLHRRLRHLPARAGRHLAHAGERSRPSTLPPHSGGILPSVKGDSTMNNGLRFAWIAVTLLLVAAAGFFAYDAGTAHGIAVSAKLPAAVAAPGAAPYPYPYAYPYWGWHRPWGFGFFVVPLFFLAFWVLIVRGLFWRRGFGSPRGRGGCGPDGPGGRLDEWHRRAHERWHEPRAEAPAEP
jgi:predicted nucleic acid-binding protein